MGNIFALLLVSSLFTSLAASANSSLSSHLICQGSYTLGTAVQRTVKVPELSADANFQADNYGPGRSISLVGEDANVKYVIGIHSDAQDQGLMFFHLYDKAGNMLGDTQAAWIKGQDFESTVYVNGFKINGEKLAIVQINCYQDQ